MKVALFDTKIIIFDMRVTHFRQKLYFLDKIYTVSLSFLLFLLFLPLHFLILFICLSWAGNAHGGGGGERDDTKEENGRGRGGDGLPRLHLARGA